MNSDNKVIIDITHFSDVLCVWAYISQIRVDELHASFPGQLRFDYRFLQVFGDVPGKMAAQWSERGGIEAYAAHVQEVSAQFDHIQIDPKAWVANTPTSSLPAHLMLCGVKVMVSQAPQQFEADLVGKLLNAFRHAFFVDVIDISNRDKALQVAAEAGVEIDSLVGVLNSGAAHAQLAADLSRAAQDGVRSSPTLLFNEGRQVLAGNVGYRVLEANVRELLRSPAAQQSWC